MTVRDRRFDDWDDWYPPEPEHDEPTIEELTLFDTPPALRTRQMLVNAIIAAAGLVRYEGQIIERAHAEAIERERSK